MQRNAECRSLRFSIDMVCGTYLRDFLFTFTPLSPATVKGGEFTFAGIWTRSQSQLFYALEMLAPTILVVY